MWPDWLIILGIGAAVLVVGVAVDRLMGYLFSRERGVSWDNDDERRR